MQRKEKKWYKYYKNMIAKKALKIEMKEFINEKKRKDEKIFGEKMEKAKYNKITNVTERYHNPREKY